MKQRGEAAELTRMRISLRILASCCLPGQVCVGCCEVPATFRMAKPFFILAGSLLAVSHALKLELASVVSALSSLST